MALKLRVSPEAPVAPAETIQLKQKGPAAGLRLGFLDNSKSNADHLLRFLAEAAGESVPIRTLVQERKYSASKPLEPAALDKLAQETDFVLSAMAD